jgi:hypothetical protein
MPAGMLVDGEALDLLVMAASMTLPMAAWMRFRGHSWRVVGEMSGAMNAPTVVALALVGTVAFDTLMVFEHVAMLLAMLAAMLVRPSEYTHTHGATVMA